MKTIGNLVWFVLALALLPAACGPKGAPGVVTVPENISQDALEPLVRSIDLVPLETHGEDFLGEQTVLYLADGKYLLKDPGNRNLFLYGPDGKFLNRIGRVGRGPGEYHRLMNALYANGRVHVYQGGSDMLVYRPDGTLEKAVTLPSEGGNAFYPLKDGWLNYVGFAYAGDDMIQWVREGQEPVSLLRKQGPAPVALMQERPFSEHAGRIFMPIAWSDDVYAFADGKAEMWLDLDFGRYTIGDEFFGGNLDAAMRILQTRYGTLTAYWENDRMRVVEASRVEKKEGKPSPERECLYGLFLHGKWNWVSAGGPNEALFAFSVAGIDGDALVCLLDPLLLKEMDPALKAKISNPQVIDTFDEYSNYVVAKLHLK